MSGQDLKTSRTAGGATLEMDADHRLVFLRLNRAACARLAGVLSQAATSPHDALRPGSEEAEDLTDFINASLVTKEATFGEIALDETLGQAHACAPLLKERLQSLGGLILIVMIIVAFVRGLIALLGDARHVFGGP